MLLSLLIDQELCAYQMLPLIDERSEGKFVIQEGSLYPTLHRLEDNGYISSRRVRDGKRKKKVIYRLESFGERFYYRRKDEYFRTVNIVIKLLQYKEKEGANIGE